MIVRIINNGKYSKNVKNENLFRYVNKEKEITKINNGITKTNIFLKSCK